MRPALPLVFAAVLFACAPAGALGPSPEPPPKSSLQLIAEAVDAGRIDEDTATLYRVYAAVAEEKLPAEYRGSVPMRDATPVLREARSRYDRLRPEIQDAVRPYLFPRRRK
ncbi:MAG: hypothetical protein Kow0092_11730 [Deferrisomatales bacterium]